MIENSNSEAKEDLIEDVEVQITEDPPESEGESEGGSVKNDDELENYTKSVSKRINKLNQKSRGTCSIFGAGRGEKRSRTGDVSPAFCTPGRDSAY